MDQNWPVFSLPGSFYSRPPIYSLHTVSCLPFAGGNGVVWVQWRPGPLHCCHGPVFLCGCRGASWCPLQPTAEAAPGCGRSPHAARPPSGSHLYITPERSHKEKWLLSHVSECRVWVLYAAPPGGCRLGRRVWSFWGRRRSRDGTQLSLRGICAKIWKREL